MAEIKFIMTTVKVEIAGKTSIYFLAHELNLQQIGEVFWVSRRVSRYVVMKEKLKEMKLRVASHLFDEMSERNHVRIVHVFVGIKTKLSLELVGNGLVVPIWDPGISLKTLKLTGHTSNVREILIDMTSMVCLHRSSDNINRVWDTGWQWFMHSPVVHIDSICSVATIPTYSHVYSGTRSLSLHVTTSSSKKIMLFWSSILPLTLHDDSKRIATIYLSIHYWSVDGCTIRKASQRRGSVMARNLSTARVKVYLAEQHVCRQCQPWSFGFILLVAIYSGAFNFGNRLKDGKATWLQITRTGLLVNWSTKTKVKLGAFSLGTFWKVEYARGTSIVDVVGLHILLSNTNDSAKLRDEAATVRTMVYGLYLTFDPGGMSIGLEKEAAGLHPIKIKHFNILHQHTCIFTGYVTSFFPILSWSRVYESEVSSNIAYIVFLLIEKLALHRLHQQLGNFCWSILNTKEVECCFHGKKLYFLIATTPETRGLSHLFQFDPGISFLKKHCSLSDSEHNLVISTSGIPKYTTGILLSAYNAFSLCHWNDFEILREHLCLSNIAKCVFSLPFAEDSKKHIHVHSEGQIFVGLFAPCRTEIPLGCLGSVDLQKQLHISTTEAEKLFDRIAELQTKMETILRKSTSLSLLRDIRDTIIAKVNQSKSLIETFAREVFTANRHITLGILARNNLMILVFDMRVWTTTLRTMLISSRKDCNEPGRDNFLIIILGVKDCLIRAGMS
ncbi:hypothetical protein KY285_010709 [Solanum tuberosum]|nr:hypothetical protein KY289_012787 [Solanum tuberosum]KAH0735002.1 hypothetical protein KY285_010709 [Solanum tuberosum]